MSLSSDNPGGPPAASAFHGHILACFKRGLTLIETARELGQHPADIAALCVTHRIRMLDDWNRSHR